MYKSVCEDRVNWLGNYLFSKQVSRVQYSTYEVHRACCNDPYTLQSYFVRSYASTYSEEGCVRNSGRQWDLVGHPNECGALVELKLQGKA